MTDLYLDDPALRAAFAAESAEHLASLEGGLLQLEQEGQEEDLLRTLLRSAHTLKASARLFRLEAAAEIAHQLEEALVSMQRGALRSERDLITTLLRSLDALRAALRLPGAPAEPPPQGEAGLDPPLPAPPPPAVKYVRVPVSRLEAVFHLADGWSRLVQEERRRGEHLAKLVAEVGALRRALFDQLGEQAPALRGHSLSVQMAAEVALRGHRALLRALAEQTAELQARVGELHLQSLAGVLAPLARAVREEAARQGKEINLVVTGDEVELDDYVLQGLSEPLTHLVRNALDHGIEELAERRQRGKPAQGTIAVATQVQADTAIIEVRDNGRGVDLVQVRERALSLGLLSPSTAVSLDDDELLALIFRPGLTTRATVDATSGRGMGMDIVRERIARLGGRISIETAPGQGTVVRLSLPLIASTTRVLVVVAGGVHYAIPTVLTRGVTLSADPTLPVFDLGPDGAASGTGDGGLFVLLGRHEPVAVLRAEAVLAETATVLRPFNAALGRPPFVSGGTLLLDGTLALVLDPVELVEHGPLLTSQRRAVVAADSAAARAWLREALQSAGWAPMGGGNGYQALAIAIHGGVDLVVTEGELPGLGGLALTRALRADPRTTHLPVIVVSTGDDEAQRRQALAAGARAYVRRGPGGRARLQAAAMGILDQVASQQGRAPELQPLSIASSSQPRSWPSATPLPPPQPPRAGATPRTRKAGGERGTGVRSAGPK